MKRIQYLDYARAVGILAVVWVHAVGRLGLGATPCLKQISFVLCTTSYIPLLFLVAGCLAKGFIVQGKNGLKQCFLRYAQSVLLPFYSLCALFFLVNVAAGHFVEGLPGAGEMAWAVLRLDLGDSLPSGVLWFFFVLFLFSMTASLWEKIIKASFGYLLLIALVLKIVLAPALVSYTVLGAYHFASDLCYYVLGICMAERLVNVTAHARKEAGMLAGYAGCVAVIWLGATYPITAMAYAAATLLGPLLVISLLSRLKGGEGLAIKVLHYIGVNAIVIYVFHMPSFKLMGLVADRLHVPASLPGLVVWFALGVAIPLGIGLVLSRIPLAYRLLFARSPYAAGSGRGAA